MRIDFKELTELWNRMDTHMKNAYFREELRIANYSPKLHESFSDLLKAEPHPDRPPVQQELIPLLDKVENALQQIITREQRNISIVEEHTNKALGNIRTLFNHLPNKQVEELREKHDTPAMFPRLVIKECTYLINTIRCIKDNPAFQQTNPALQGHSLEY